MVESRLKTIRKNGEISALKDDIRDSIYAITTKHLYNTQSNNKFITLATSLNRVKVEITLMEEALAQLQELEPGNH